jgi:hypothetical protein
MIIRILSEGQFEVDGETLERINILDEELMKAIEKDDEARFNQTFHEVVRLVRSGTQLEHHQLSESDLILPASDTTLNEAKQLFIEHPLE